jgi:hypothetical protein
VRTERSEPILPARSLDETRAFYKKLGFDSWFNGRGAWEYEIFSRGHLVVHFFLESGQIPGENDTMCYWRVGDADQFYNELARAGPSRGRHTSVDSTG